MISFRCSLLPCFSKSWPFRILFPSFYRERAGTSLLLFGSVEFSKEIQLRLEVGFEILPFPRKIGKLVPLDDETSDFAFATSLLRCVE